MCLNISWCVLISPYVSLKSDVESLVNVDDCSKCTTGNYKTCPRYCTEILRVWLTLSNIVMLWCLGITVTGTRDIGSLVLLRICWPYILLVISWTISLLLCWWRPLGLVLNDIVFVLIPPYIPIASLSLYSPPYHRRRCFSIPLVLDWRALSCMSLGYPGQESFMRNPLSLKRSMQLTL